MSAGKPPGRPPEAGDAEPDPNEDDNEPAPFGRWFSHDESQPARDWLVGRVVGDVLLGSCIGQGGMGRVYTGLSRGRGHAVAVKVIEPGLASIKDVEALRREAQILGLFDHPGIAPVYAAGTQVVDGREVPFLVMKLIKGARTIVDYAIEEGLNTKQRVKLFRKVCAAVGHGHGKSIIHRDLKPSNILVDRSGRPFVIDFGVARSLNPELTRLAARDRTGEIPGTYAYMSPEQFAGNPDAVDKRTDVYSLGLILYELLTGKLPHDIKDKNVGEISRIVQFDPPVPIERRRPDLKPAASSILRKCLEKRPADRFPDAVALLSALKGRQRNEPFLARAGRRFRSLARAAARHRSLLLGVLFGACLALVGERLITSFWGQPVPVVEPKKSVVQAAPAEFGRPSAPTPAMEPIPSTQTTSEQVIAPPPPPDPVEPPPLDTAALEGAVREATALGEALDAADDKENRAYKLLRTRWYKALARVAEELVAVEHVAATSGRSLDGVSATVAALHSGIDGRGAFVGELAALAPNWLAYDERGSDGVVLPVTFESARKVGPYWTARMTLAGDDGTPRDLTVISRTEPAAIAGDRLVVIGVAVDVDTIWAADLRTLRRL